MKAAGTGQKGKSEKESKSPRGRTDNSKTDKGAAVVGVEAATGRAAILWIVDPGAAATDTKVFISSGYVK